MNFFGKKDFKTKQEELKKQKRLNLKKQEEKFNNNKINNHSTKATMESEHHKATLNELLKSQEPSDKTHELYHQDQIKKVFFKKQSDGQLYNCMKKRLQEQQDIKRQQRQLINLGQQIQSLKTENTIIQAIHSQIPSYKERQQIMITNSCLKQKISEMQAYLISNGAFWEGDKIMGQFNIKRVKEQINNTKLNYRTPSSFQFDTICKRIQQLNQSLLIEFGTTKVMNVNGISSLSKAQTLKVEFYKNLIRLDSIGSFQYNKVSGIKILADLNDGYYPRVCKDKYPNGVLMQIINNLDVQYNGQFNNGSQKNWFFGKAFTLIDQQ